MFCSQHTKKLNKNPELCTSWYPQLMHYSPDVSLLHSFLHVLIPPFCMQESIYCKVQLVSGLHAKLPQSIQQIQSQTSSSSARWVQNNTDVSNAINLSTLKWLKWKLCYMYHAIIFFNGVKKKGGGGVAQKPT